MLLDLMDSFYSAHLAMHFAYWALPVPGCDDAIIDPATGEVLYVLGFGGFTVTFAGL
jgi:hypothetical protein